MRKQLETFICVIVGFHAGCRGDAPAYWRRPRMLEWLAQTGLLLVGAEPEFSLPSPTLSNAESYRVRRAGVMDPFQCTSHELCTVGALAGTSDVQYAASATYVEPPRCCSPAAVRTCSIATLKSLYDTVSDFRGNWCQRALMLCQLPCALSRSICPV